jgi:phosphopantetheine adenylyltransferase
VAEPARGLVGCYPGSFNPPTIAHLAVAQAAVRAAGLARLDLVLSRVALGKEDLEVPTLDDRAAVLREVAASRPWLGVVVTDARLIVDIAEGYDAVVMGADKWRQVNDESWYASEAERDAAVARLPRVLVAPRAGDHPADVEVLDVGDEHHHVSASDVRSGADHAAGWILPEAAAFAQATGAWPELLDPGLGFRSVSGSGSGVGADGAGPLAGPEAG